MRILDLKRPGQRVRTGPDGVEPFHPDPVRRGVIRSWLLAGGAIGLTDKQIRAVDKLVTAWRGQGGVAVGSALREQRLVAGRSGPLLRLAREPI